MREYKVIYVDTEYRYISYDNQSVKTERMNRKEQETLLNQLANEGWRLVQTVSSNEDEFYLYLEREV